VASDWVKNQATKYNYVIIQAQKNVNKAAIELLSVWEIIFYIKLSCYKPHIYSPFHLNLEKWCLNLSAAVF